MGTVHDRLEAELRAEDGAYIVAPSSADPWPVELWQQIDIDEVVRTAKADEAERQRASAEDLERYTSSAGIYFTPGQIAVLQETDPDSLERIFPQLKD